MKFLAAPSFLVTTCIATSTQAADIHKITVGFFAAIVHGIAVGLLAALLAFIGFILGARAEPLQTSTYPTHLFYQSTNLALPSR